MMAMVLPLMPPPLLPPVLLGLGTLPEPALSTGVSTGVAAGVPATSSPRAPTPPSGLQGGGRVEAGVCSALGVRSIQKAWRGLLQCPLHLPACPRAANHRPKRCHRVTTQLAIEPNKHSSPECTAALTREPARVAVGRAGWARAGAAPAAGEGPAAGWGWAAAAKGAAAVRRHTTGAAQGGSPFGCVWTRGRVQVRAALGTIGQLGTTHMQCCTACY